MPGKNENLQEPENNENLQEPENIDNISNALDMGTRNAGDNTPEDTYTEDPYKQIIEQQNRTIDALLERTESLTGQINQLLQMGVQINTAAEPETSDANSLPDDYVTLSDLGAQFGKRE